MEFNEENKKVRILGGGPGQNRATITEQELDTREPNSRECIGMIRKAGELVKPFGSTYVGSACVHYYVSTFANEPTFHTAPVVSLDEEVHEQFADYGWKELRSALMKAFGRKEPAIRK